MIFKASRGICRVAVAAALISASIPAASLWWPIQAAAVAAAPGDAATRDVDFGPYMADLQRRIKKQWFPPRGLESKRVVVAFKVHHDGIVTKLRIDKSSGATTADRAALEAVEVAAPMRPLPVGSPENVDIQFTFDYNVFGYKPEQILQGINELEQKSGNHDIDLAKKYVSLGFSYAMLDNFDKAHHAYDKGISMLEKAGGAGSRDLADAMQEEARYLCGRQNDYARAKKLLDTAMAAMGTANDLQRSSKIECDLAQVVEIPQNHYVVAEQLLRKSLADASAAKATHAYNVAIGVLASLFVEQGRTGKAASLLSDAMEHSMARGADSIRETAVFGGRLIDIYLANHDAASARKLVERLSSQYGAKFGNDSPQHLQSVQFGVMVAEKFNDDQLRKKYLVAYSPSNSSSVPAAVAQHKDGDKESDNATPVHGDVAAAASLNNEGVKILVEKNYSGAIKLFQEALKVAPDYRYARENLGIAYNNLGLLLKSKEAVDAFHKSLFFDPDSATTIANLTQLQHSIGERIETAEDRNKIAEHCLESKDFVGAVVEYRLSLRVRTDSNIELKLPELIKGATQQLSSADGSAP